jgi:hypothetical protein
MRYKDAFYPVIVCPPTCAFGCWNSVYKRFNAWSAAGKWLKVFNTLLAEPDFEWAFKSREGAPLAYSQRKFCGLQALEGFRFSNSSLVETCGEGACPRWGAQRP